MKMDHAEARWQRTVPQLFAAQVRERPDEVAVSSGGAQVSFAELGERADRIAAWLTDRGVGRDGAEDVVAVHLDRGHDVIAALLGVLKAGAAFLALDVGAPEARRQRLVAAAGAVAVVSDGRLSVPAGTPELRLPDGLPAGPVSPVDRSRPDGLAYICFTSGSTGRPKGVGVPHRAVVRLVEGGFAELGPGQTFLHLSPLAFDASVFEIWSPLLTGGRLAVHPPGPLVAEELAHVLAEEKVTTLWLTAGLFHRMVDHHLEELGGLHQLVAGGDVLNPGHVNRFLARFPSVRLINGYGPTENTTFTTCHPVTAPVEGTVPIGRPITGTQVRVLDDELRPVPAGGRGELCVAGAGLSRGYLGDPRATAEKFLPDPYAGTPGARMYRTGDIVGELSDGVLAFFGRGDRQVKIRGFRVEPAEVEQEIAALPGVRQAVVVVRTDDHGDRHLVAHVVPAPGELGGEHLAARVRRALRAALPAAMIPSVILTTDELPLTANGKVDAAALSVPTRAPRQSDSEYLAPRTPVEQLVCDLWAEALAVERVGVADDFFELGGNSLLAMDLISRTEAVFDVELPIRALLHNPTVEEFAEAVEDLIGLEGARA
jgi:amino acid adenylation domain-containing protein